jgi:hypothetical protein
LKLENTAERRPRWPVPSGTSTASKRPTTYLLRTRDGRRDEYVDVDPELKELKPTPTAIRTTTTSSPAPRRAITATISSCPTVTFHEPDGETTDLAASFSPAACL